MNADVISSINIVYFYCQASIAVVAKAQVTFKAYFFHIHIHEVGLL